MLNQVVLVGRLTKDPEVKVLDNGKKYTSIIVAVSRSYKNSDGLYDTDFVKCTLWNGIAANTCEYCHSGDVVGIKGRLQVNSSEVENNIVTNHNQQEQNSSAVNDVNQNVAFGEMPKQPVQEEKQQPSPEVHETNIFDEYNV